VEGLGLILDKSNLPYFLGIAMIFIGLLVKIEFKVVTSAESDNTED
tara:strand:- start:974 stop:1111 length:138 start_codon:yes stop_codon:yes gene_type:complete